MEIAGKYGLFTKKQLTFEPYLKNYCELIFEIGWYSLIHC